MRLVCGLLYLSRGDLDQARLRASTHYTTQYMRGNRMLVILCRLVGITIMELKPKVFTLCSVSTYELETSPISCDLHAVYFMHLRGVRTSWSESLIKKPKDIGKISYKRT